MLIKRNGTYTLPITGEFSLNQSRTNKNALTLVNDAPQTIQPEPVAVASPPPGVDEPTLHESIDRTVRANLAKATSGIAPSPLAEAWMDWVVHLGASPGKQMQLVESALKKNQKLWSAALGIKPASDDPDTPTDRRFAGEGWQQYPFNLYAQAHLQNYQWWQEATTDVHGVAPPNEDLMAFVTGLLVDATSPSNFAPTNADVASATVAQNGQNLVQGTKNMIEDLGHKLGAPQEAPPQLFEVGRNLAITPGKVVYRNELIELIQYTPTTDTVHPEPILIVPAWIMKYYILDLSPEKSLVSFLVAQGYTVFIVSWKNPGSDDSNLGMDDYLRLGVMDALDATQAITQAPKIHAVGYCLGGTLLAIAAAAMGRDGDDRLASASFLAAQIDFTEAGQLKLFINEAEISLIEDLMAEKGFLSSEQMAGTFALLRARDLIWAPKIRDYMLGVRGKTFDLMAWNSDATRMPARMHSEYLRKLYLNNELAEGHYQMNGQSVTVSDIRAPIFAVGTENDHVAPWHSVYKFHLFADVDVNFVLTSGGHNAGIVSEPGHRNRHFRMANTPADAPFRNPSEWLADTDPVQGSWWPAFTAWLDERSGKPAALPPMGTSSGPYAALCDAPGTYVMQK
ncbi:PHA/PHB synthase family protein [Granulosicoccus antarcticus]|uniref:Poly-beta-hydroxybutyrate polymerase n=1 Tax=Granulosicoccus antarcticus IMCC3135 TaxID=1192854 RepID=A0A2Z2NW76_9GAMM|nr:alpha/beta fold hydrolase [Granulosicoccus antarcticus]ASJ74765.1 Poly-beta-hydroxybutyrate polymerase [Granulosicoccus antarcticus IMCC3135]